jgi:hypothetical protein
LLHVELEARSCLCGMLSILTVKAAILLVLLLLLLLIILTLAIAGRLILHSEVILDEVKHVSLVPCP